MAMRTITIDIDSKGINAQYPNLAAAYEKEHNATELQFVFRQTGWASLDKRVLIQTPSGEVYNMELEDDRVTLPLDVLVTKGKLLVQVIGRQGENLKIKTPYMPITVSESLVEGDITPSGTLPSTVQLDTWYNGIKQQVQAIDNKIDSGVLKGEKGDPGSDSYGANVGSGIGIYKQKTGENLLFKSISAKGDIYIKDNQDHLEFVGGVQVLSPPIQGFGFTTLDPNNTSGVARGFAGNCILKSAISLQASNTLVVKYKTYSIDGIGSKCGLTLYSSNNLSSPLVKQIFVQQNTDILNENQLQEHSFTCSFTNTDVQYNYLIIFMQQSFNSLNITPEDSFIGDMSLTLNGVDITSKISDYTFAYSAGIPRTLPYLEKRASASLSDSFNERFANKKIACIGDSITYGVGSDTNTSWVKYIGDILKANSLNYGISGSTIAYHATRNPMCNRYTSMDQNADVITVLGGVNDWANSIALGVYGDTTTATFYGALDVLFKGLINRYPGKIICAMTPLRSARTSEGAFDAFGEQTVNGKRLVDFAEAIKNMAARYALPILDLNKMSGIAPDIPSQKAALMATDGIHPNDEGYKVLGNKIAAFILSL